MARQAAGQVLAQLSMAHRAHHQDIGIVFLAAPFVLGFAGLDAWYYWANAAAVLTVVSLHKPEAATAYAIA